MKPDGCIASQVSRLTIFNSGVAQLRPGFGKDAMEQAGPECQRFEVGIHAAFWRTAPATLLFDGAGSLCGETGVVSGLG